MLRVVKYRNREGVAAPHLETSKARLDAALSSLWLKMSLVTAVILDWITSKGPFQPQLFHDFMILWAQNSFTPCPTSRSTTDCRKQHPQTPSKPSLCWRKPPKPPNLSKTLPEKMRSDEFQDRPRDRTLCGKPGEENERSNSELWSGWSRECFCFNNQFNDLFWSMVQIGQRLQDSFILGICPSPGLCLSLAWALSLLLTRFNQPWHLKAKNSSCKDEMAKITKLWPLHYLQVPAQDRWIAFKSGQQILWGASKE